MQPRWTSSTHAPDSPATTTVRQTRLEALPGQELVPPQVVLTSEYSYHLELETDAVLSALILGKEEWDSPLSRAMPFHAHVAREGLEL